MSKCLGGGVEGNEKKQTAPNKTLFLKENEKSKTKKTCDPPGSSIR